MRVDVCGGDATDGKTSPTYLQRVEAVTPKEGAQVNRGTCSSTGTPPTTSSQRSPHASALVATRVCVVILRRTGSAPIAGGHRARPGMYRVEHQALEMRSSGQASRSETPKLRKTTLRPRVTQKWLDAQHAVHASAERTRRRYSVHPQPVARARTLLDDAKIPLDNNISERALDASPSDERNFLFVGDLEAGKHVAGLYSLIATCEARDINPFAYLADVVGACRITRQTSSMSYSRGTGASIVIR
ncbi:MAG: transposase [Sandaracinaceae bacterium]|nr:transposase [Sandaracinaceae bacterium]